MSTPWCRKACWQWRECLPLAHPCPLRLLLLPRSTVPFVAKAVGHPIAKYASLLMSGEQRGRGGGNEQSTAEMQLRALPCVARAAGQSCRLLCAPQRANCNVHTGYRKSVTNRCPSPAPHVTYACYPQQARRCRRLGSRRSPSPATWRSRRWCCPSTSSQVGGSATRATREMGISLGMSEARVIQPCRITDLTLDLAHGPNRAFM